MGLGGRNNFVGITSAGELFKWTPTAQYWTQDDIPGGNAKQASVGSDGTMYAVSTANSVYRKDGAGAWTLDTGGCVFIDVADYNNIVCIGTDGNLWKVDPVTRVWQYIKSPSFKLV